MVADIDEVAEKGDTLGGTFRVIARGVPLGLGSYVHWDRKLDGRLAQAMLSINAIKGVEFGAGFEGASRRGSQFHDEIDYQEGSFRHLTNRAGGLTGGVTNGEPIDLRVAIKPISTMKKPMPSIDLNTKEKVAGALRAQRRVRGAGRRSHRRGDGRADAGGGVPGEVRRRLDGGARAQPPRLHRIDRRSLSPERCSGRVNPDGPVGHTSIADVKRSAALIVSDV